MLAASAERILENLQDDEVILDVGGWAAPFARADWVIDLLPYATRGLYSDSQPQLERFDDSRWIERDICDREPFPFAEDEFDFAICSHTLEDIRDPVWVCSELQRVAKAGYIEVPSRLEEQSWGVHGDWVGWAHHRWLVEIDGQSVRFVVKPHHVHGPQQFHFPPGFAATLTAEERVQTLFWRRQFEVGERVFTGPEEIDAYLADYVSANAELIDSRIGGAPTHGRFRRLLGN